LAIYKVEMEERPAKRRRSEDKDEPTDSELYKGRFCNKGIQI